MRNVSAPALILDVVNLRERDRIVTFLTAERGKKRGVARGARAKYSRFAGQLQPLAKVAVTWFEKEGSDLVRLSAIELVRPAAALQTDLEGILLGTYLAETLSEFVQEDEAAALPFRLLDTTLEALLAGVDPNLAARYFEVWVLRLAGIFPPPRHCPLCERPFPGRAVLLAEESALVCPDCARAPPGAGDRIAVPEDVFAFLVRTADENLDSLRRKPPSAEVLRRVEQIAARIRRQFLQGELKSYRVMQQTLDSL
jgi:DNA repair protein RecO (recombination protein O)